MMCNVKALNGEHSRLHGGLYRYYKEAGLDDKAANSYAMADWAHTRIPEFSSKDLIVDPNSEPELHFGEENRPMHEVTDDELHVGLASDRMPVYMKVVKGVQTPVNAVRAKPSILNYDPSKAPPPESMVKMLADQLSKRFNVEVVFVSRQEAEQLYKDAGKPYKGQSAFVAGGKAYAVNGQVSELNLIHEVFGHPFLDMLQQEQFHVYSALVNEAMRNEDLKALVAGEYPEEVHANGIFTEAGKKELILKALELDAANRLDEVKAKGFVPFINRFWKAIKNWLGIRDNVILNSRSTIKDLTRILFGNTAANLQRYVPQELHSTMTGAKPQTAAAVKPARPATKAPEVAQRLQNEGTLNGRIIFVRNSAGEERYIDTKEPNKKIIRSSEMVDRDLGRKPDIDRMHLATIKATKIFKNQGKKPENPDDTVTLAGGKTEYTFNQLKYKFIREVNDARDNGKMGHALIRREFQNSTEVMEEIKELMRPRMATDGSNELIASGVSNIDKKFAYLYPDPDDESNESGGINEFKRQLGYHDSDEESVVLTEHMVYDPEWNIAGRIDLTMVCSDGELVTADHKFGKIDGGESPFIIKYADLEKMGAANASRLNLSTLNMVLRNVMYKKKDASLKWKAMEIASFRSGLTPFKFMDTYELQHYLDILSKWSAANHPDTHQANVEKGIFEADNYWGETLETNKMVSRWQNSEKQDIADLVSNPDKALMNITNQMININSQLKQIEGVSGQAKVEEKLREDLKELTVLQLQWSGTRIDPHEITALDDDMPIKIISDNYNQYDATQNMVVALKDIRNEQAHKLTGRKSHRHQVKQALMDALKREKGISHRNILDSMAYYKGDGTGFWDFMWIEEEAQGDIEGKDVRIISKSDAKYKRLKSAEKAWIDYIHTEMERAYNTSVANREVLTASGRKTTKAKALNLPDKWDPNNARVYVPMLEKEEAERDPRFVSAIKRLGKRIIFSFMKTDFEMHNARHFGLPVKYLSASDDMRAQKLYSLNGEHVFETFMEHMDHLELMEGVYATASGIRAMLMHYHNQGKYQYKNTIDYLENYILQHIEARKNFEDITFGRFLKSDEAKARAVSVHKAIEQLRSITTFTTLSMQPVLAGLNTILISSINYKTAAEYWIGSKFTKGKQEMQFTPKTMTQGYGDYLQLQKDIIAGTYENNKLYHILREFKWTPDNYDFITREKSMGYVKHRGVDKSHLLFLHALAENMGNVSILSALLRSMQIKAGNKTMSAYDAYTVDTVTDSTTNIKIKTLGWKGGVRGYTETTVAGTKQYKEITRLTSDEIDHFKKISARITGDYRQDERGAAEMNALWNMTKQFKRYMFRYFKNAFQGAKLDTTLGRYINSKETYIDPKTGSKEPILEWERTFTEGWMRTMFNGFMCTLLTFNLPGLRQMSKRLNIDPAQFEKYKWKNLNDFQRQNVVKGISNFLFLMASIFAIAGYDKDDDFLTRRIVRILGDSSEGANLVDILKSWDHPFPVLSKMRNILQYGTQAMVSDITDDRTREGDVKGLRNLARQFGPTASILQVQDILEGK
jgi:hypothetical protein